MSCTAAVKRDNVLERIRDAMRNEVIYALTTGRIDEGLDPYNRKQLLRFLSEYSTYIDNASETMLEQYEREGELSDLMNADSEWYREFLYSEENQDLVDMIYSLKI